MTLTNAQTKLLMDEISKLDSNLSNRTVRLWDSFQYAIDSGKSLPEYLCENFNFSHISQFRVMYSATYKAAGVNNRQDFLKILEINKDDSELKVKMNQLQRTEARYKELLMEVDYKLAETRSRPPEMIPTNEVFLTDCESGIEFNLHSFLNNRLGTKFVLLVLMSFYGCPICLSHLKRLNDLNERFSALSCCVVVVCKGSKDNGLSWKRKSGLQMPILADEKGEFVLRFSFGRSIWETFRPEQFDLETKPESHQNFVSDSVADFYQIGGDILMERSGKILFCYRSHSLLSEADELKLLSMVELHKSQWDSQKAKMSRTCVIS